MSACIERNIDFMNAIEKASAYKRKRLIKSASADNILSLKEVAHNILRGNLKLCKNTEKKLRRHRKSIRHLAKNKSSIKTKQKFLVQKGGFLPLMVTPLLSAVGSITGKIVSNALGI